MLSMLRRLAKPAQPQIPAIYVPQDVLAPEANYYEATIAVVDYTNAVMHDALYLLGEFPQEAFQIYNADYYMAEVLNGGHSQFLHNDRMQPGGPAALEHALAGMELIGYSALADTLRALKAWVAQNPAEAAAQDGFANRAEALDDFDADFFALRKEAFYEAVNEWLRHSPVVETLSSEDMGAFILGLQETNPRYVLRTRTNSIAALDAGLTTDTVAFFRSCVAGATARDIPFDVKEVLGGRMRPSGEGIGSSDDKPRSVEVLWSLNTISGPMTGTINAQEVVIYVTNPEDGTLHRLFERPAVRVREQLAFATEQKPARYAYEIGQEACPDDPVVRLGFLYAEREPAHLAAGKGYYVVTTQSDAKYLLMVQDDAAAMCDLEGTTIIGRINGKRFKALQAEDTSRLV